MIMLLVFCKQRDVDLKKQAELFTDFTETQRDMIRKYTKRVNGNL